MPIYQNITELIGKTPIVKLNHLAPEGAADMLNQKLSTLGQRPIALSMIEKLEREGLLQPGSPTSSLEATGKCCEIGLLQWGRQRYVVVTKL